MTPTEKVLEKLAKIKAHAESAKAIGNEAEAEAFAGMLQQLLLKHKLEMTDIEYAQEMKEEPIIEHFPERQYNGQRSFYKDFPDVEIVNRRTEWIEQLAYTISKFYACQILVVPGRSVIGFVGHKSNVEICEYLFLTMLRTANNLSDTAAKKFRREWRALHGSGNTPGGYRESFLDGFVNRIFKRLEEEQAKYSTTGTAIVRVNKEALAVKSYVDEKFKKHAKPHRGSSQGFNPEGYKAGQTLADGLNLKANAVKSGRPNQQIGD